MYKPIAPIVYIRLTLANSNDNLAEPTMKVSELIALLQQQPADDEVVAIAYNANDDEEYTKLVFNPNYPVEDRPEGTQLTMEAMRG